ncbi:hypothetical protein NMG60_11029472 [Bertholletia excelsa]
MLYGIAGRLLGELASPAVSKLLLLWGYGAKCEIRKLERTVSAIKAVLLDAEKKRDTNHAIKDWLEKLQVELYELDDVLDDMSTEALRRKVIARNRKEKKVCIFISHSNQLAFRLKIGSKIKKIRKRLDGIAEDRIRFNLSAESTDQPPRVPITSNQRETHSFVPVEEVIGRERDKDAILQLILDPSGRENVTFMSIVGIGGLGKTTLAQMVFNDKRVKTHFDKKIWVCVSDVFDVKTIITNIVESITGRKFERPQMDGVVDELKRQIDQKKYFLVLDDVWNEDPNLWMELSRLLISGARGSKVLVTTRSQLVAEVIGTTPPYLLEGLSKIESWSLFKKVTCEDGTKLNNPTMEKIGMKIVDKCAGVPLAIRTVGGLLHTKNTEKEWLYFRDYELQEMPQPDSGIMPILKLSYNYLPPHLKQCFIYCSLFPKDYEIDKKTLIQLWIAQGFIQLPSVKNSLEDIGDLYFMDLLRRSFFQDVQVDKRGVIQSCRMHDLIHDLAKLMAGRDCFAYDMDVEIVVAKARHLSLTNVPILSCDVLTNLLEENKLRTFLLPNKYPYDKYSYGIEESTCQRWMSSFKHMRALDLNFYKLEVPSSIGALRHLRYLDLSYKYFKSLPNSICKLYNLETLKLNTCRNLKELPRDMRNLVNLRHLEINGCGNLQYMPCGLGELTSLHTLSDFKVDNQRANYNFCADLSELQGLVNLRGKLKIRYVNLTLEECNSRDYYIKKMEFLESLKLMCFCRGDNDILLLEKLQPHSNLKELEIFRYQAASFPSWMVNVDIFLPSLVHISLTRCHNCQILPPFGLLPCLRNLELKDMNLLEYVFVEEEKDSSNSGSEHFLSKTENLFPSLKRLELYKLKRLKGIGGKRRRRSGEVMLKAKVTTSTSTTTNEQVITTPFEMMRHFSGLEDLSICDCPFLDLLFLDDEENCLKFQNFKSLTHLSIIEMQNLKYLPLGLHYVSTLQSLTIERCQNLVALPEEIGHLKSLQTLCLLYCKQFKFLPKGMQGLTTLRNLNICGCDPNLRERYNEETVEDWPKIAHILHKRIM